MRYMQVDCPRFIILLSRIECPLLVSMEHPCTCIILVNPKKKETKKETYYFNMKYKNEVLKNMCELFRIGVQAMMLRPLWYFPQGYFQRM